MPSHFMTLVAAVCLVLLAAPVHGWSCNGHMLVAMIAQRHLKPGVSEQMEEITARLRAKGPFPQIPDFVQLACWADDIKAGKDGVPAWHFINTPYNPEKVTIAKKSVEDKNVVTAIEDMVLRVKTGKVAPYTVEFAVANLVHFYGDIHQPLHAAELFSASFPQGDRGGNSIKVKVNGEETNLHALWDSMCQGLERGPSRPLSEENYNKVGKFADYLEKNYQFTNAEKNEVKASVFAGESFKLATSVVYKDIESGMTVSKAYLEKCKKTSESRVALAGHRLATVLNSLFA